MSKVFERYCSDNACHIIRSALWLLNFLDTDDKAEVRSVMRPSSEPINSGYNQRSSSLRRGKGKHRLGAKYMQPKAKRMNTF